MLVIYYVCVSAAPLIFHAECSLCKLLSILLKKEVFTCFGSVPEI